ncbi:MAG TPA: hypothetical protein VNE21_09620, partial [Mycobacteriales bacterium]|nr:hypothetical protein [Mycobacteriales bacterium]
ADTANPFPLAVGLVASWLGVDDLADDGAMNGSVSRTPSSVTSYDLNQTPVPGSGDPCVHNDTWTCPGGVIGFQGSYPYTVSDYTSASGCELIEFVAIHGMEHAIPDGPAGQPYTDPLGPDMTAASYDFFLRHPLSGEADGGGPAGNPRGTGACGGPPGSAR